MKKLILIFLLCLFGQSAFAGNPVDGLIERVLPGASKHFKTEIKKDTVDFFELDNDGRRVVIRANSWVNAAVGLNWYLKHHAGIHLSWNGMTAQFPSNPPLPKRERHETDLKLRYDFNYCTFSYSMPFWGWEQWEKEIDWMALHGVNMPLAIVGMECVWRNMLLKLGYTEEEVGQFISGPAFLAWWAMNNLEGWGGPNPASWYDRQEKLQKKILARMEQYGMTPVLPGYCGMVPHDASQKLGINATDGGIWNGYVRPANLSPTDPSFDKIADLYYSELTKLFGKSKYYSLDPFHESNNHEAVDYAAAGRKLMEVMKRANPESVWVVQCWTQNPRPAMIEALNPGDILILDLYSECSPHWGIPSLWKRENGFGDHDWVFNMLLNFGGNIGLHGRMDQLIDNFYQTKTNPMARNLKGYGFTMEGSKNNPVMFEMMSELPWIPEKFDKEDWVKQYVKARYGCENDSITKAWNILANSIYNCPAGNIQQGTHESIFCARPSLNNFLVSAWSKMRNYYDPAATLQAAKTFASVADQFAGNNNYEYDLVDITRQALADQARRQYHAVVGDYRSFARESFKRNAARFLEMLDMQDELLGTRPEFMVGSWIAEARDAGLTEAEKDRYEWNARVQITTWGNRTAADKGNLRDYAHKEWNGILRDFYRPRWVAYFDALDKVMDRVSRPGEFRSHKVSDDPVIDWYAMEEPWTLQTNPYPSTPQGDPIKVARQVLSRL